MCLQKRGESEAADTFLSTALKPSGSAGHRKILPTTLEIGPWSPLSSEGSGKGFRKFSEWECRTIPTIYAFGPFRLDVQGETLFRDTEPVALSKRAVALLRILVERARALVSKDTLIDAAWSGLAVEESNLTVQIAALRRALGEVPGGEDWIVTLPRRGYRFVAKCYQCL